MVPKTSPKVFRTMMPNHVDVMAVEIHCQNAILGMARTRRPRRTLNHQNAIPNMHLRRPDP
eukprot:273986-Amphidinium_carterae.2